MGPPLAEVNQLMATIAEDETSFRSVSGGVLGADDLPNELWNSVSPSLTLSYHKPLSWACAV